MDISIGNVSSVKGTIVKALIAPHLNKMSYFYDGRVYRGIAINEFIIIRKGYLDLIGKIEGEEILELKNSSPETPEHHKYNRYVEIKIVGYLDNNIFNQGVKYLPMIGDDLYLINDKQLEYIYDFKSPKRHIQSIGTQDGLSIADESIQKINLGKTVLENQPINLPIDSVFASHIGIFGNTGSGKSNTLAKLYLSLFESRANFFEGKSTFLLIDFNGEYGNISLILPNYTLSLSLSTQTKKGEGKLEIDEKEFWDAELLSVLYSASEKTQKPFLQHLVRNRIKSREEFQDEDSLTNYFRSTLERMFGQNQHKETYNILVNLLLEVDTPNSHALLGSLKRINLNWHSNSVKYYFPPGVNSSDYINNLDAVSNRIMQTNISEGIKLMNIGEFDLQQEINSKNNPFLEVTVRALLQLINSTSQNYFQYEHVSPLINKITAIQKDLAKVIKIVKKGSIKEKPIQVLSLRNCNAEMKKTIAMLLAKTCFSQHKKEIKNNNRSFHFIIDEAHNVLSEQSTREASSWKDYRLELFEEIIKEGRKFGFFVTIASQRPSDISPTIISQLHNYFLHRLVNENDLNLLKNTISTLDNNSRSLIPILPPGACVISGVAFHTPVIVQVEKLMKEKAPNSETISLVGLWEK